MRPVQCRGLLGGAAAHLKAATLPPFDAADLDRSFDSDILQGKLAISPLLTLPWPLVSHVSLGFCFILHLPPPLLPQVWLLDHLTSLQQAP